MATVCRKLEPALSSFEYLSKYFNKQSGVQRIPELTYFYNIDPLDFIASSSPWPGPQLSCHPTQYYNASPSRTSLFQSQLLPIKVLASFAFETSWLF